MTTLFDPVRIGDIALANRIVMAPLTRDRAGPAQVPGDLAVTYYAQRASAGLIISEGTQISPLGQGYLDTPGIYSPEQLKGWRRVTDAVHAKGGKIVAQIWHVGRISHTSLLPKGESPVSSTAHAANSKTFTANGFDPVSTPRALTLDEVPKVAAQYGAAARNAVDAGFDGVELHGANGYLIDQFIRDTINDRTDAYGGSVEHRIRFALEAVRSAIDAIGAGRVGIRLSPVTPSNDARADTDAQNTFGTLVEELGKLKIAFIHVVEGATGGARDVAPFDYAALRARFKKMHAEGAWIVNNGYTRAMALDAVASGYADAVAFGKLFISNPDLVRRLREDAPLQPIDQATLYGGTAKGYTDYPTLDEVEA